MKKIAILLVSILLSAQVFTAMAAPYPPELIEIIPKEQLSYYSYDWSGREFYRALEDGLYTSDDGLHYTYHDVQIPRYEIVWGNGMNVARDNQDGEIVSIPEKYRSSINNGPVYIYDENWNLLKTYTYEGYMGYLSFNDGYFYYVIYGEDEDGKARSTCYKTADWEIFEICEKLPSGYKHLEDGKMLRVATRNIYVVQDNGNPYGNIEKNPWYVPYYASHDLKTFYPIMFEDEKHQTVLIQTENKKLPLAWESPSDKMSYDYIYWYDVPFDNLRTWVSDGYIYNDAGEFYYRIPYNPTKDIYVILNGTLLAFEQPPVLENERTLVPMRFLFEQMGAIVSWNSETQTATVDDGETTITFTIDNQTATVNGTAVTMDVPARLINSQTFVPLRFLSETLGYDVKWDGDVKTVFITK